jgi:hypothetical protein
MNIPNTVLKWLIFDFDYKSIFNVLSILNVIQNPIRNYHSAFQLKIKSKLPL